MQREGGGQEAVSHPAEPGENGGGRGGAKGGGGQRGCGITGTWPGSWHHLSVIPKTCSKAHRLRQKPSLGLTRLRRFWQCLRARAAFQAKRRMRYAMHRLADRLTPAPQCTSTPGHRQETYAFTGEYTGLCKKQKLSVKAAASVPGSTSAPDEDHPPQFAHAQAINNASALSSRWAASRN